MCALLGITWIELHASQQERRIRPGHDGFCQAIQPHSESASRFYFRTFWPDHAEYMVLPPDPRRTGSRCTNCVETTPPTIIITVVTDAWQNSDAWRIDDMAKSLRQQSLRPSRWWVFLQAARGRDLLLSRRVLEKLRQYTADVVHGSGQDLVNAIRRKHPLTPASVFFDENFNSILEHTALEKFVLALRANDHASAVTSWSVAFNTSDRVQHYVTRNSKSRQGSFMVRTDNSAFWKRLKMALLSRTTHSVSSMLLCDPSVRVKVLADILYWEMLPGIRARTDATSDDRYECMAWTLEKKKHAYIEPTKCKRDHKSKASLLLIIPWLEYGGADQFNVNLVRNLAWPHRIHVVVATTTRGSDHPLVGDIAAVTEDIFHLDHLLPIKTTPDNILSTLPGMVGYLALTRDADVLLLSNSEPGYLNLPAIRSQISAEVKIVDFVHSVALDWRNGGYARYSLENRRWLDHTLVSSMGLKQWLKDQGHPCVRESDGGAENVHVVYIGVDTEECKPSSESDRHRARLRYGIDSQHTLIIFPARMSPEKNPARFFRIIKRVLKARADVTAVAVGQGPLLKTLRASILQAGLEKRIVTTGALSHDKTIGVISISDIVVLTSDYEGISLSVFESMAAGVIPFSTDVGSQRELIDKNSGVLVALNDEVETAFAEALLKLLSNPAKMKGMKTAARARVKSEFNVRLLPNKIHESICS